MKERCARFWNIRAKADFAYAALALILSVASGAPCALWGENDTRRLAPREAIDPEYLNPLYDAALADLWRRDAP